MKTIKVDFHKTTFYSSIAGADASGKAFKNALRSAIPCRSG